jgi:hypothetical protein
VIEPQPTTAEAPPNRGWWWETLLIVLLCYLKAGWPPPDVNEAHYLAKAKHFWDPQWCANDFFLNTADAHAPFYVAFGWVTVLVSLPAAAWIGRFAIWGLIAWAWQRLSWRVTPTPFSAVISGGLMIVLTAVGHVSGEWIIGGVEAKGFAYGLVFLGLEQLLRRRWNTAFVLLGGAAALHVLVGGWAVVAGGICWLFAKNERPLLVRLLPGLTGGFALSLFGLLPVLMLNAGVDAETTSRANQIYVFERLRHHLVFNQLPHTAMALHAALAVLFFVAATWLRKKNYAQRDAVRLLTGFVGGAVALAVIGAVIDQATLYHPEVAAELMRFYWFRLSDILVPAGVGLLLVAFADHLRATHPTRAAWGRLALLLGFATPLLIWNHERQQHPLPGAALQSWQQQDERSSLASAETRQADWIAACDWIEANTPASAIFLTPKSQQTFKWYAQRAEVVSLKDVPQDGLGIVEWRRRVNDVFAPPANKQGYSALTDQQIIELASRYDASFVIVDDFTRVPRLLRVYPTGGDVNESFAIYRVPRP